MKLYEYIIKKGRGVNDAGNSYFQWHSKIYEVGFCLLVVLVVFNFCLINTVSKSLSDSLVQPIYELKNAVQKIKEGVFEVDITYEGRDELGELADEIREACANMHNVVADTGYVLGEMASGHFDVTSHARESYVGEFQNVIFSMESLNNQLSNVIHDIRDSAERLMGNFLREQRNWQKVLRIRRGQ